MPVWVTVFENLFHRQQKFWHISTHPSTKQKTTPLNTWLTATSMGMSERK